MPKQADEAGTTLPEFVRRLAPCNNVCPAGEDTRSWLVLAGRGDYEGAWRSLVANNPLPAIMGRVCYHPCEGACNRSAIDSSVGINSVERFLGDLAISRNWLFDPPATPSGKQVLVVGAGPTGLSAAYQLARRGHAVTIHEAAAGPGGMLRYGIPKYRLPRQVIDAEVARIADLGVTIKYGTSVADIRETMQAGGFDAAFLAVGAHVAKRARIPAAGATKVLDAVQLLAAMERGEVPQLGRRVVVYGGGNTAMDVARTARRLDVDDVTIVYRRTREQMPAHDFELEEALEEGVKVIWLSTITAIDSGTITIEKMTLDAEDFPQPTGAFDTLAADSVVLALGQDVDLSLLRGAPEFVIEDGVVAVDDAFMTGAAGIFAGGDMAPSDRTVTVAVGQGRKAAEAIDAWLKGEAHAPARKPELATRRKMNLKYYDKAPGVVRPTLDIGRRVATFDEVVQGLDEPQARSEAQRCLSCGVCNDCDNCYTMCPEQCVIKLGSGEGYAFELERCTGCGVCAVECPPGAIRMVVRA